MKLLRALALGSCLIVAGAVAHPLVGFAQEGTQAGDIDPPLPESRPTDGDDTTDETDGRADADNAAASDKPDDKAEPPLPRSRPDDAPDNDAEEGSAPPKDDSESEDGPADDAKNDAAAPAPPVETVPEGMSAVEVTRCEKDLKALGATFEVLDPIAGKNGCGVARPYNVSEIDGIKIRPRTQMTCDVALALARWVRGVVQPSAAALGPDVRLSEITHASTYVCRRRNNRPTGKLSEHAKGQAIDIIRFAFEGHKPLPIIPRAGKGTMQEAFQRTVQAGGCLHFTTVLGPGSDDYHDDHLHFDVIKRSSGYRLCQ
ncbi:extensin family protein [Notoacmeibacter marinus]|uniref:extensin-like domain-containing protein n=1 Tax=Notoacmeibacter marinus TaxID=1876515 RepID=UPI000DF4464F|nr:extensin family protein [Notoacmeibacter marinus]